MPRALADADPLLGIAQLTARWAVAFVLETGGVSGTKALGTDRVARKLRDALPGGEGALRAAVSEFVRPHTCGGGYGDPQERDPELVLHDAKEGWVSIERAESIYGVVVIRERDDLRVDLAATARVRSRAKGAA